MTINRPIPRISPRKIDSAGKPAIGTGTTIVLVLDIIPVVVIVPELVIVIVIGICCTRSAGITGGARNVLAVRAITANRAAITALKP
jgi:hypothetical protein